MSVRKVQSVRPLEPCRWSKRDDILANWDALRANPEQWYDNRARKTNPRQPDFVRKDDRSVAIWIDGRDAPENVADLLAEFDAARQEAPRTNRGGDRKADEQVLWENLRNHPEEWYDNRARKTNPRAPDFTRRDDRSAALWCDSYNAPEWLGELIEELDIRRANFAAQRQQQQQSEGVSSGAGDARRAEEWAKWESLRNNPNDWFDNRNTKANERQPDFRRKDDRMVALWLTSRNLPPYINDLLAELDARGGDRRYSGAQGEQGYPQQSEQQYQEQPYPQQREERQRQPRASNEERAARELPLWESLRDNPEQWFDNRRTKINPRAPDFKRKDDRNVALWATSYAAPDWAPQVLEMLDERQAQRAAATGQQY
ncbi:hypothetical protein GPECTOR_19g193 [Gonium pectorale]|uniref:Uncharacterized protein n=1 Tax=Gonium pectorale TaxID=33097 RepID=A0A150GIU8_GONPE|nr:hypothetical protein GPECTOR_19g193 [Gonium pectorale]|eukprot:KXZ49742.1 hypothetical protein GPECTOR_19g193 [Gonium pectorale]